MSENKEMVCKAFHKALRHGNDLDMTATYDWDILVYLCGILSVQNEKKGFVNFLGNLSLLPKLKKRLNDYRSNYHHMSVLHFLVVQVAAILLYDGDWIAYESLYYNENFEKLYRFLFGRPSPYSITDNESPLRAFGIDNRIKTATANNDAAKLKLLVDMAPEPEKKLKNIYVYLLNNEKWNLAVQLHSIVGKLDKMIPPEILYDFWEKKYVRAQRVFSESDFQELHDDGISMDLPIDSKHPSLTLRAMWHFYAEFADDLLALNAHGCLDETLMNHVRSAKNFIQWETKAKRREMRHDTAKNA